MNMSKMLIMLDLLGGFERTVYVKFPTKRLGL